ncbi:hypothetical protein STRCI_000743 [Streptomyces cinnabarinus]|uniref:TetR family transcriptional regulator n=1 Tax=Streptomyces cinnabarinus TaxID=67287 RepID=A0ABY7K6A5_9ACTN|nr:hypothetical protein [Streptomyces cinnabarinus]WAZ19673.1 hypothetical protein STRCI_000743 [Streptomyces cinnabarinus]
MYDYFVDKRRLFLAILSAAAQFDACHEPPGARRAPPTNAQITTMRNWSRPHGVRDRPGHVDRRLRPRRPAALTDADEHGRSRDGLGVAGPGGPHRPLRLARAPGHGQLTPAADHFSALTILLATNGNRSPPPPTRGRSARAWPTEMQPTRSSRAYATR